MYLFGEKFVDHFLNPRNVGEIENPDSIGIVEEEKGGGKIIFYIKVNGDRIIDIKYKILGCPSAISSASLISESFIGATLEECLKIDINFLKNNFGDLSQDVLYCGNLSIEAFKNAIINFLKKEEKND
ncbi:MAG: iron-sulfur cluster assembly scaffold protein [Caldisericia bacterium]|jgi:nitrogen fixation NifU-like protein|nr:iron-sulfur cluster assembly scaffold protein [Caldisericia bacterium]